jgi:hypothetical protein
LIQLQLADYDGVASVSEAVGYKKKKILRTSHYEFYISKLRIYEIKYTIFLIYNYGKKKESLKIVQVYE